MAFSALAFQACRFDSTRAPDPDFLPVVQVEALKKRFISEEFVYPGQILANREIHILAEVAGNVSDLSARMGAFLRQGQRLMNISPDPSSGFRPFHVNAGFSGNTSQIYVHEGERVQLGQKLVTLTDNSRIKILTHVNLQDLGLLKQGDRAEWWSFDETTHHQLTVAAVAQSLDPKLGTAACELVPLPGARPADMISGSIGRVRFAVNGRQAIVVNPTSLVYKGKKPHVILINEEKKARYLPIRIIKSQDDTAEIQGEFPVNGNIVVQSSNYVGDGEKVRFSEKD